MTEYVFTNNAEGTLDGAIGGGDTSLSLHSGEGSRFPTISSGQVFYILVNGSTFMLCTGRSSDTFTVTRTDSDSFSDGAPVKLVLTATILESFLQKGVYREYAGSPDGLLTNQYIGEEVLDTTNSVWYKSISATSWKLMNGVTS